MTLPGNTMRLVSGIAVVMLLVLVGGRLRDTGARPPGAETEGDAVEEEVEAAGTSALEDVEDVVAAADVDVDVDVDVDKAGLAICVQAYLYDLIAAVVATACLFFSSVFRCSAPRVASSIALNSDGLMQPTVYPRFS